MKSLIVQACLIAFATISGAQLLDLPSCAQHCADNLPPECGFDVGCICSNADWITGISCCVKKTCTDEDQQKTIKLATDLCKTAKVTLPQAASCPGSDSTTPGTTTQSSNTVQSSSNASASDSSSTTNSIASSSPSTTAGSKSSTTATESSGSQSTASPSSSATAATKSPAAAPLARPGAVVAGIAAVALALL